MNKPAPRVCISCKGIFHYDKEFVKRRAELGLSKRTKKCNNCHRQPTIFSTKGEVMRDGNALTRGSVIRESARRVVNNSGRPRACYVCGYSLHTEVCHIKAIKDHPDDALISDINHPDNLVILCRNHHWEFDHGHLKL